MKRHEHEGRDVTEETLIARIVDNMASVSDEVADDIREYVRSKLEQALNEDTQEHHWLIMAEAEGKALSREHRELLTRSDGFQKGVQRVAKLLDIEIFEPYEPDV